MCVKVKHFFYGGAVIITNHLTNKLPCTLPVYQDIPSEYAGYLAVPVCGALSMDPVDQVHYADCALILRPWLRLIICAAPIYL